MNNFSIVIFTVCFTVALCAKCERGWRYSPHSGKCFKFNSKPASWSEAEYNCRMEGGYQISIHSAKENRFFKEIVRGASEIWLGSAKFGRTEKYKWSDQTAFNFRGWKNGQIPLAKSYQPCTKMNVTNGEWFQSCCRIAAPYICQRDPRPTTSYNNMIQTDDETTQTSRRNPTFNRRWRFLSRK